MNTKITRIVVDNGVTFEGSVEQFSNCFFNLSRLNNEEIKTVIMHWAKKELNGSTV